jgi:acetoin utilization protein AcuC
VSSRVTVVWDERLTGYDFGPGHPLAPVRVELTIALARAMDVLDREPVELRAAEPADDDTLQLVHTRDYLAAVRAAGDGPPTREHGLGSPDNPVFPGMHDAAALVCGASLAAATAVWSGGCQHAVNIAGGLHHAMADRASGFCVYNDPAVAIAWLLRAGARKVAYVDTDVHHGDGVQARFAEDPRVLTISLHESGRYLFPGTGFPDETGRDGTAVNVALPPGTGDAGWLRAFFAVVPPLLRAFAPEILVSQHGCDTHALDPLAHLMLSVDGQRRAQQAMHQWAHELCEGRWLALGGGGYELVQVVPRCWTHLLAELSGTPIAPATEIPEAWRRLASARGGQPAPEQMTDGHDAWFEPWMPPGVDSMDGVDRAVLATREAVFPLHDLDPVEPA